MYTDDIDVHTAKMERKLEKMPVCADCGDHIQDETYWEIPFFGKICKRCLREREVDND